mmetsp:Transcript_20414/g.28286  ORF Transcript_20414/g.28286 Transcript_20414/m.28286 type:complete len:100 (-) Transcript_20414:61-360(-)
MFFRQLGFTGMYRPVPAADAFSNWWYGSSGQTACTDRVGELRIKLIWRSSIFPRSLELMLWDVVDDPDEDAMERGISLELLDFKTFVLSIPYTRLLVSK